MSSLLTNTSALTALQTLRNTNQNLDRTTNRIATGERVSTAKDNAAYWSIATSMKNQNTTNSAIKDTLGLGSAILDATSTALKDVIDIAKDIQAKLATKGTAGGDDVKIDAEVTELKEQILAIAEAATFNGVNLLKDGATDIKINSGYAASTLDNSGDVDTAGSINEIAVAAFDINAALDVTDVAKAEESIIKMQAAAAKIGVAAKRVESQKNFTDTMMKSFERGIGQLVDADMEEESARLKALQTQQQLGVQALSIANSSSQNVLQLFR